MMTMQTEMHSVIQLHLPVGLCRAALAAWAFGHSRVGL